MKETKTYSEVRWFTCTVYLNPFIRRVQKQSFFPDTPITSLKTKKGNFWTKCQCSMVSWLYMETKTFRGVLCTQMTCQNQINLLAVFSIWKGYLHMMNMFIGQSEISDPWCCTKRIVASGNKIGYTPIYFKGYATVPMLCIFWAKATCNYSVCLRVDCYYRYFFCLGFLLFLEDAYLHAYFGLLVLTDFRSSSW